MAYKVTITYVGVEAEPEVVVAPIASMFTPDGSYIDSPAYTDGVVSEDKQHHPIGYGRSVYATNVPGMGPLNRKEPYASTSIPFPTALAQFKLAVIGDEVIDEGTGKAAHRIIFNVDDYKEALYYKELAVSLADQGFKIKVESAQASAAAAEPGAHAGE